MGEKQLYVLSITSWYCLKTQANKVFLYIVLRFTKQQRVLTIPRFRPFVLIRAISGWRWVRSAGVILTGEKWSTCRNPCRSVTLSTTNPTPTRRLKKVWAMTRTDECQRAAPRLAPQRTSPHWRDALHRLLQPVADGSSNRRTNSATNCKVFVTSSVSKKHFAAYWLTNTVGISELMFVTS